MPATEFNELGHGAAWMPDDCLPLDQSDRFGANRLQANIISSSGLGAFDPLGMTPLEFIEQPVLQINRESQHAVQNPLDRRKIV